MLRRAIQALVAALAAACLTAAIVGADPGGGSRSDGAKRVAITGIKGSLQNACYAPDGKRLAITQWVAGYNAGEVAIVHVVSADGGPSIARVSHLDTVSVNL